ncbi:PC-Esterase [Dillenia turbinata]|uniref:PC-Esterase n=1 Tax=Dillenia turbinata TaxID=194707 RepID=A0AAN8UKG0_9MAGN
MTRVAIQEHQNCLKYEREDLDFLKWKWKPNECVLPKFDASQFLEAGRGKSLAFVGDSIARNRLQSLICLLARVEYPDDVSTSTNASTRLWRQDVPHLNATYSYKRAFHTAFKALYSIENYRGITFLRTFSVSHFEGGTWNEGGNCLRTRPYAKNERLEDYNLDMYIAQIEEFSIAESEGNKKGLKFKLMDTTKLMLFRPDGHPSVHWHYKNDGLKGHNDCVHRCLSGPVDTWNEFLFEMAKMEQRI